jgi:hypothetical protein
MSRSRRKTSVIGITRAESEKQDKREYNRRYRHTCKQFLNTDPEAAPIPILREHSNIWSMDKDGKTRFDPTKDPELMRK